MLIIGLGNPGAEYTDTRHNIGFKAVDQLSHCLNFSWKDSSKFKSHIASGNFSGEKLFLIKPQTYMNLSGEAVSLVKNYYSIDINDIVVIHDDLDIKLGQIRYKQGGGHAGHNGLKSIDQHIGKNYHRIRVGIGRPDNKMEVSDYVLGKFLPEEKKLIQKILDNISNKYSQLIEKNFTSIIS